MAKAKSRGAAQYRCAECDAVSAKWLGQCPSCGSWNSLEECAPVTVSGAVHERWYGSADGAQVQSITDVAPAQERRWESGIHEFDRVLGGGLVAGSVVLIGGDPGIGKSTLLLQVLGNLSDQLPVLYVSGEESPGQIALRAQRLGLLEAKLKVLAETRVDQILDVADGDRPAVIVVDSIQTVYSDGVFSAPGSVTQVRESAAQLVRFAKQRDVVLFIVGHVTKEGVLAGPRILEHMVDTVLYFEGTADSRYRILRTVKNRFGAVNELGVFAMLDAGLREVRNPSAIFLARHDQPVSGSIVTVGREGSRNLLVEVQALVAESHINNPRRVTVGLDANRVAMLLAVVQRHCGLAMYDQDVFINAVGGVRLTETAADLAAILAAVSSFRNRPVPPDWVVFGEIGLGGEVRPVPAGLERLQEAQRHGFKRAIVAYANQPRGRLEGIVVTPVKTLADALAVI